MEALGESGLEESTLVVFTSDHGDQAGSHRTGLKGYLYEESARVPLIVRWKSRIPGGRIDAEHLVSNGLDLLPTICDLAGARIPADLAGASLVPLLESPQPRSWRTELAVENNSARAVHFGDRWKYMCDASTGEGSPYEMLVNLADDPGEMTNLAARNEHAVTLREGRQALHDWYASNCEILDHRYEPEDP